MRYISQQSIKKPLNLTNLFRVLNLADCPSQECESLFVQALTHKSYILENDHEKLEYDRLEFLGDSVLKLVINEYIFHSYKTYNSGQLTKLSAYLLSDKTLLRIAQGLQIKQFIRTGFRINAETVLSDVMESLFGACYLVFGFKATKELILRLYKGLIEEADSSDLKDNYKAALQELTQSRQLGLPEYVVIKTEGPPHNRSFEVEILLNGVSLGTGKGVSKKEAGQAAAKDSLAKLQDQQVLQNFMKKEANHE